ncbi:MAG: hypothetical protein AAF149_13675 [Bacteroidota bacterium]
MKLSPIYLLSCPKCEKVHFVGAGGLHKYYTKRHSPLSIWLKKLHENRLEPVIEIIDQVVESEEKYCQNFYAELLRTWGFQLLNFKEQKVPDRPEITALAFEFLRLDRAEYKIMKTKDIETVDQDESLIYDLIQVLDHNLRKEGYWFQAKESAVEMLSALTLMFYQGTDPGEYQSWCWKDVMKYKLGLAVQGDTVIWLDNDLIKNLYIREVLEMLIELRSAPSINQSIFLYRKPDKIFIEINALLASLGYPIQIDESNWKYIFARFIYKNVGYKECTVKFLCNYLNLKSRYELIGHLNIISRCDLDPPLLNFVKSIENLDNQEA